MVTTMVDKTDKIHPIKGCLYAFFNRADFDSDFQLIMYEEFDRIMINGDYLTESGHRYTDFSTLTSDYSGPCCIRPVPF